MSTRFKETSSPTGLLRTVVRTPILFYRWHLGRLVGHRVLLLTHTGRISGEPRRVVLEIVASDPRTGTYLVASGFGPHSQWYRNIKQDPVVTIQVGGRRMAATAHPLTPEESGKAMAKYAVRHPNAARKLMHVCGLKVDGTAEDYYLAGRDHIPFVRLSTTVTSKQQQTAVKPRPQPSTN